jgi:hypothetical protein
MKRFTSTEIAALIMATAFVVVGFIWLVWPREMVILHVTNDFVGWPGSIVEYVNKRGSRIYGVMVMLLGAGIAALALYRSKT